MKTLIIALSFFSISASACPQLAGEYWCMNQIGDQYPTLDGFVVKQWQATDPSESGITYYSTHYSSIPGEGDVFRANASGMEDDFGWKTQCKADRLVSVSRNSSAVSEMYLDQKGYFIRALNRVVVQKCAPKKSR